MRRHRLSPPGERPSFDSLTPEGSRIPLQGSDWKEVRDYERYRKYEKATARVPEIHDAADLDAVVGKVNRRAIERTRAYSAQLPEQSKSSQTKNIHLYKQLETAFMQKEEARQLVAKEFPRLTAGAAQSDGAESGDGSHLGIPEVTGMSQRRRRMMRDDE